MIGRTLLTAFGTAAVVSFGKESIELGSDLAEVQNVVDVTFSHMSASVDDWAKSAQKAYGLSETMAKNMSALLALWRRLSALLNSRHLICPHH